MRDIEYFKILKFNLIRHKIKTDLNEKTSKFDKFLNNV